MQHYIQEMLLLIIIIYFFFCRLDHLCLVITNLSLSLSCILVVIRTYCQREMKPQISLIKIFLSLSLSLSLSLFLSLFVVVARVYGGVTGNKQVPMENGYGSNSLHTDGMAGKGNSSRHTWHIHHMPLAAHHPKTMKHTPLYNQQTLY
jgi:hypothetical protein